MSARDGDGDGDRDWHRSGTVPVEPAGIIRQVCVYDNSSHLLSISF